MKEIEKEKLNQIDGGGLSVWGIIGIVSGAVFIIGAIDGYFRPLPCNK